METSPTSSDPIEWNDLKSTITISATTTAPTISPPTTHLHCRLVAAPTADPTEARAAASIASGRPDTVGCMAAPTPTIVNRRARHDYFIDETFECGIALAGGEVKSIRDGKVMLRDAYARVENGEVWLYAMHMTPYAFARAELEPEPAAQAPAPPPRDRRARPGDRTEGRGARARCGCYFKDRRVKMELGVGRGKKSYDKRQSIAERDAKREAERALKAARR